MTDAGRGAGEVQRVAGIRGQRDAGGRASVEGQLIHGEHTREVIVGGVARADNPRRAKSQCGRRTAARGGSGAAPVGAHRPVSTRRIGPSELSEGGSSLEENCRRAR